MDDLSLLNIWLNCGSNLWDFIWFDGAFKYRPVAYFFMRIGFAVVGSHTEFLWLWMLLVNFGTAVSIYRVYNSVIQNELLAGLATCVYILARLGYYAYGQYFGIMEQIATLFVVLVLPEVLKAVSDSYSKRHILLALILSVLATFTHERYMSLLVLVIIATLLTELPLKKRFFICYRCSYIGCSSV